VHFLSTAKQDLKTKTIGKANTMAEPQANVRVANDSGS
jgi:hypothetical protein